VGIEGRSSGTPSPRSAGPGAARDAPDPATSTSPAGWGFPIPAQGSAARVALAAKSRRRHQEPRNSPRVVMVRIAAGGHFATAHLPRRVEKVLLTCSKRPLAKNPVSDQRTGCSHCPGSSGSPIAVQLIKPRVAVQGGRGGERHRGPPPPPPFPEPVWGKKKKICAGPGGPFRRRWDGPWRGHLAGGPNPNPGQTLLDFQVQRLVLAGSRRGSRGPTGKLRCRGRWIWWCGVPLWNPRCVNQVSLALDR